MIVTYFSREVSYLNKIDISKILKLWLGSSLAIFMAYFFQLQYAMVAGVITLLVVKDTKKENTKVASTSKTSTKKRKFK